MTDQPTITPEQLRRLTGATPEEIARLTRSGQIVVKGGRVPLIASIRAVLDLIRTSTKDTSLAAAQDAARLSRAEATEFALQIERKELVPATAVSDAILHLCGGLMARMSTVPTRATRDIRDRRKIEAALAAVQHEIAAAVARLGDDDPMKSAPRKRGIKKGKPA